MTKESKRNDSLHQSEHLPHRMRLPGFISDEEIGLGDAIQRTTAYFGIKPCGGCKQRAAMLNRWLVFTRQQPR
ncbi:hypothetical protein [Nitrosomonas sp. Nm166]|uniref:hypothetical protein n=1 Tax=Nitrosomonas sp. Nm166 TaxID=1881054 RepID=UPI0008E81883|nr:hypothetical protein [Nitrosomonas sp. Nm166]SFE23128.1 hypothetical protein SAMN05428977_101029 [Nitrosomonas sp. Nm166]